jgi:hypothetical protein
LLPAGFAPVDVSYLSQEVEQISTPSLSPLIGEGPGSASFSEQERGGIETGLFLAMLLFFGFGVEDLAPAVHPAAWTGMVRPPRLATLRAKYQLR